MTSGPSSKRSIAPSTSSHCRTRPLFAELAALGVGRVSVGGAFAWVALAAVAEAANELRDQGTYGYFARAGEGSKVARAAFSTGSN